MIRYLTLALFAGLAGSQIALRPPAEEERLAPLPEARLGYGPSQAFPCGLKPLHLSDLAREAETIVVGKVRDNRCSWNDDRTMIWTDTRIEVLETWAGEAAHQVVIREPGGIIPPVGIKLSIETRYRPGERVLVFLTRDALGQVRTLGSLQGRLELGRRDGREVALLDRVPRHLTAGLGVGARAPAGTMLLEDLRHAVLSARARIAEER
jgi:hypothetical protein